MPLSSTEILRWRNALFVIFFALGFALASYMARVPTVRDTLEASTSTMSVLAACVAVGSVSGMIGGGYAIGKIGAKRAMLIFGTTVFLGLIIVGVGVTVVAFPIMVAGLFFAGFGMGTTDIAMNISGAANETALRRTIMPIYHAVFSFGTMAGAGVGALAERLRVPVGWQLITLSVIMIAALVATNRSIQSEFSGHADVEPRHVSIRERLAVWAQPTTLLLGIGLLGMALAEGSANDWLALAMVDGHGVSNGQGALALGLFLTAMTLGRIAGVRVLDRFGRVPVLRGSAVLAALGLTLVIFTSHPALVIAGIVLWGVGSSLGFPVGMSAAADDIELASARVSAVATIGYVAFLVGPVAIGFLGERYGLLRALLLVLLFIVAAGVVAPAARERELRG